MPQISVIIPTYNRLQTLPRAISSVFNQTFQDYELIVVDDGSTDETSNWLHQQQKVKKNFHYIRQAKQLGVSSARNKGIEMSQGKWLAFLDSDDEWLPHKLEEQIKLINSNPQLLIVHGEEIWIRNGQRVNPMKKHQKCGGRIFSKCLPLCLISPSAVIIHCDVFNQVGLFNEEFVVCEDYDLWLRITSRYEVGFIETPLIKKYGGHEDQLSHKYHAMDYWRVKSLASIIDFKDLSPEEKFLVNQQILKKTKILLTGYQKHNNLENFEEIYKLNQRAQAFSAAHKA